MDHVEDELELMKARLAGVHRVLDQVEQIPLVFTDYQPWERALQQIDAAYLAVSTYVTDLVGLVDWEQIGHILEQLHQLVKHVQDHLGWPEPGSTDRFN